MLLLHSAAAVGGDPTSVLPAAVGTEVGHVASLIHDDIIDGDDVRRGQEAVHCRFGMDSAIVAGDALIFDLFACLAECRRNGVPDERVVTAMEIVARAGIELCYGQVLESEITAGAIMDVDAYYAMIRMKTAALFRGACQCGAVLAGGSAEQTAALTAYGEHLGMAFQILDDLLGYLGDGAALGKPAHSDLRNRRLTLPILLAYQEGSQFDRAIIDHAMGGQIEPTDVLAAVGDVLRRTGALQQSVTRAADHAAAARQLLSVLPQTPSRELLASFADRAVNRLS